MDESNGNRVRAVSYLRVSSVGQIDGDGFDRQRDAIAAYADAHGFELVGEYRDEGVSGTVDHADRDGFTDLLARIAGNGVRVVIVERPDRLARSEYAQEALLRALMRLNVKVIDVASGMDLTDESDPSRILIRRMLGLLADFDKACLVAKLRKARQRKRSVEGRCEGRKPYGYRQSERGGLERICDLAAQGMSARQIANSLNADGVPSRGGKPWTFGSVARVVRRVQARTQTEAVAA